ncbi:MAG: oxidoreductase [Acidimicrobiaceae bacterium]|nr:oxidoreductase [Acidimicrobiaceae bacterium]
MAQVAFLGLGVMGYPMAGHLAAGGHQVTVYNRTPTKALAWVAQHGHQAAPTPAEAADGVDFVMMCVGNDDDVREVALGDHGALAHMEAGSTLVDHTTASADVARELAMACDERGVGFVDAPVSGGQAGAENGQLTVMCGSEDEGVFEAARAVIDTYAKECRLLGGAGAGQTTKMVNQICIAGLIQGLAEGVAFAQRAGLDIDQVVDTISKGAAGSWQMENRARTMAAGEFDFGFAVEWMRKDLAIVLAEGDRLGAQLPVTALVDQFYRRVIERGGSRWDTSSLVQVLQQPYSQVASGSGDLRKRRLRRRSLRHPTRGAT